MKAKLRKFAVRLTPLLVVALVFALAPVFALVPATPVLAAAINTTGSGNWNSTTPNAPWPNGTVPSTNDSVVIASGHTVTIPADYTAICGDITVNGTLTLYGPSGHPGNLHVYGGGDSPETTGAISGTGTIDGPSSGGTNIEFYGDWSFNGTLTDSVSFYFYGSQDQNTAGGKVAFPRNLFISKSGGTVYFPVTPTFGGGYFHITGDAGTVCYNRNDGGTQAVAVPEDTTYYYYNLILAGSGSKTISTSGIVVHGVLSMEGTATASAAPTYGASATLRYNTATARTSGREWISTFLATGGVIIANTGTITLNASKTFSAGVDLTINSGAALNTSSSNYALTFGGDFVNNGTFTANGSPITISGTATTQSIAGFTTTGTVSCTKTSGTATFTGNVTSGPLSKSGAGTLNLGTGLTHTCTNLTVSAGTLNGGSSTLNISGTVTTGGTFAANAGTVNYNGAVQTVAGWTYYNLMTSGSGTKTLGGAVTVNSSLTIGFGTTLDVSTSNYTLTVQGDWTNSGTFTPRNGTVTLSGSGAQTMSGATTFYKMTLNNSYGLTINNDETINNTLNLTNGKITTGLNTVIIPAGGNVSGGNSSRYVNGNLQKNVTTGANVSRTFEVGGTNYNPVTVAFVNVTTTGNLTAKATSGDHGSIGSSTIDATKSVNVYWSLTNSGIVFTTYNATFNFTNPGDIDASANTTKFIVGKYSSGVWTYPTVGVKTNTSTQATGITSFCDFAVGEAAVAPTVTSVNPIQGTQGQTLSPVITGTNFIGATAVSFEAGITVDNFTVDNATQITANISISGMATPGARNVSVTTPGGTGTKTGGFTVLAPTIEISAPANITGWALSPQEAQPQNKTGTLNVTTTNADGKSWAVAATDEDTTHTNGNMTKYSGGAYNTDTKLGTAMQVQGPAGTVTLPGGGNVVTGNGTVTNAEYTITFKQTALWTDQVLTGGAVYCIVVTFTGTIT